ncbi:hypothetical protein GcC1_c10392o1 [Golovinomyces cichoracearum]|uniref:Uncharacterized protein n=1 Tax=Golovinomyces cichoracearum TaxID=62708 RepID=A0A420J9D3_9PEZI|nr:hypothetical protein GcC1_c10392o1 [Golovinomyces cichoracearum]
MPLIFFFPRFLNCLILLSSRIWPCLCSHIDIYVANKGNWFSKVGGKVGGPKR